MSLLQRPGASAFVKHFHPSDPYKNFRQKLRGRSNARTINELGAEMRRRSIAVPSTIGLVEAADGRESFIVMESIEKLPTVQKLLLETSQLPNPKERRARKNLILKAFAAEWRRTHEMGIGYAESHDRHVYLAGSQEHFLAGDAGGWHFVWIDYDGTTFSQEKTARSLVIQQFYYLSSDYRRNKKHCRGVLSRTDMLRFLHYYHFGAVSGKNENRHVVKTMSADILAWQPKLTSRLLVPVRDALRYVFRPEERALKNEKRSKVKRKHPVNSPFTMPPRMAFVYKLYKVVFFWVGVWAFTIGLVGMGAGKAFADDTSDDLPPGTTLRTDDANLITNASSTDVAAVRQLLSALPGAVGAGDNNTLRFFGLDPAQGYKSLGLQATMTHLATSSTGALVKQSYRITGTTTAGTAPYVLVENVHEFFLTRTANGSFTWSDKHWPPPTDAIEALAAAARVEWERPAAGRTTPPANSLLHLVVARRSGRWIALRRLRWEGSIFDARNLQVLATTQTFPVGYTLDPQWLRGQLMTLPPSGAGTAHLVLQRAQNGWVGLGTAWAPEDKISPTINDAASQARRAMRAVSYTTAANHQAFGIALAQVGLFEEASSELEKAEALQPGIVPANLVKQVSASKVNDPENLAASQLENEAKVGLDPNHPSYLVSALAQDYNNQPSILRALRLGLEYSRLGDDTRSSNWLDAADDLLQKGALKQASPSDQQWSQVLYEHLQERRKLSSIKPPLIVRSPLFVLRCWPNDLSAVQVLASLEAAQHTVYADFSLPMSCTEILSWRNQGEFQRYTSRFSSQGQSEFVAALTLTKLIGTREGPVVLGEEINVFTDPRTAVFHTVAHEYGHVAVRQLSRGRDVPIWFNEGIATSVEGGYDGYLERVRSARRANALLTMDEMLTWNVDGQRAFLAYSQANSIVDYIIATWGHDAIMNILRQIGTDIPPEKAFQNVLGVSQQTLWQRWVQSMK